MYSVSLLSKQLSSKHDKNDPAKDFFFWRIKASLTKQSQYNSPVNIRISVSTGNQNYNLNKTEAKLLSYALKTTQEMKN